MVPETLSLDLGSTTGWAAAYGHAVMSGEEEFDGNLDRRLGAFLRWLRPRMPDRYLVVEAVHVRFLKAARSLYAMEGVARALAAEMGVEFISIRPTEIKMHATGSGKATKEEMIRWAGVPNHNEADARAALACFLARDYKVPLKVKRKKVRKARVKR